MIEPDPHVRVRLSLPKRLVHALKVVHARNQAVERDESESISTLVACAIEDYLAQGAGPFDDELEPEPAPKTKRKVSDEDRARMHALRVEGATLPAIVAATGASLGTVYHAVRAARPDLQMRPRLTGEERAHVHALYAQGVSKKEIAARMSCSIDTIQRVVRAARTIQPGLTVEAERGAFPCSSRTPEDPRTPEKQGEDAPVYGPTAQVRDSDDSPRTHRKPTLLEVAAVISRRGPTCFVGQVLTAFPERDALSVRAALDELAARGVIERSSWRGRPRVKLDVHELALLRRSVDKARLPRGERAERADRPVEASGRAMSEAELAAQNTLRAQCLRAELDALTEAAERVLGEYQRAESARHHGLLPSLADEGRRLAARAREIEAELGQLPARLEPADRKSVKFPARRDEQVPTPTEAA